MGHRNEPARARRRQLLKDQLSLRSIPLVEPREQQYALDNHFGWKVMQKCKIGDGSFPPHLLHCLYCDKPSVEGGDYDKVTYVLFIRGKDGDLEPVDVKETQTGFSTATLVPIATAPPPKELKKKPSKKRSLSRRRLISDFYYIPIRNLSKEQYRERLSSPESVGDVAEQKSNKGKKRKRERGRSAPKKWQLRAGAESPAEHNEIVCLMNMGDNTDIWSESESEEEARSEEEAESEGEAEETQNNFINNLKKYDCTKCFNKRSSPNAELLESRLEKNQYLYMPNERYEKRPH